jgi:hypothetical protein
VPVAVAVAFMVVLSGAAHLLGLRTAAGALADIPLSPELNARTTGSTFKSARVNGRPNVRRSIMAGQSKSWSEFDAETALHRVDDEKPFFLRFSKGRRPTW